MEKNENKETQQQKQQKVCKFYLKNDCHHGDACRFSHKNQQKINNLNQNPNKNIQDKTPNHNNNNNHNSNNSNNNHNNHNKHHKNKKNTESFEPWYDAPDMWIKYGDNTITTYNVPIHVNDVIIVPKLFNELDLYDKLLNELINSGLENKGLWKPWHEDSHLIADDNLNWKDKAPTFMYVIDKLKKYFNIDIKATRLNWYTDSDDFKPFHFDSAAVKPHIAKIQNITIGVSFGLTRDLSFQHAKTKLTISIPQENGMAYSFSRDVNINFRHGVAPVKKEDYKEEGRISIIGWGYVPQIE